MIPVDPNEYLPYEDKKNGIRFLIAPMVGENEYQYQLIVLSGDCEDNNDNPLKGIEQTNKIFDTFVKGWESIKPGKSVIKFPEDGKPSRFFSSVDKNKIVFDFILKDAKTVNDEEKKS